MRWRFPCREEPFISSLRARPFQDTGRLLQSPKFGELISKLRQLYDLIIIDSPPSFLFPMRSSWAAGLTAQ